MLRISVWGNLYKQRLTTSISYRPGVKFQGKSPFPASRRAWEMPTEQKLISTTQAVLQQATQTQVTDHPRVPPLEVTLRYWQQFSRGPAFPTSGRVMTRPGKHGSQHLWSDESGVWFIQCPRPVSLCVLPFSFLSILLTLPTSNQL